jgi:colanic acid/amylovoran biosynthesis glycosyltransferase
MKIALIVTEFPSTTETFIMRDMLKFIDYGHDVKLFHLLPFNRKATLHDFAKHVIDSANTAPFFSFSVCRNVIRAWKNNPFAIHGIIKDLFKTGWRNPEALLKSLAIIPKSIVFAAQLKDWGAEHVHGEFAGHPTTCAWIINRLTGITYSASCRAHDIFISQTLLSLTLGQASAIRTISRYNIDFLRSRVPALRDKPMTVIHSSVDLSKIHLMKKTPDPVFSILYVGSLEVRKGVDDLLHALSDFTPADAWQLKIIGHGPERKKLEHMARNLKFSGSVQFLGARPFEFVSQAYGQCDVVVVPSKYGKQGRTEGIPNVVIEALAHERPVITTRVSGIPELIKHTVTGLLVEPGERIALTRAIETVCQDRNRANKMAKQGRRAVEQEFDLDKNTKKQITLFQEAIGQT